MTLHPGLNLQSRLVHFIGIGGIGMSGIAEVLSSYGVRIRGSDKKASDVTERLSSLGIDVRIGHDARNVEGVDVVVISSAVRPDNAELVAARAAHVPVIRRAEMLAELMRMNYSVAIAGTHGKTTTTSLVATLMREGGLDPTVVVGGKLNQLGSNAQRGQGHFLVAEADESDGSFLALFPTIALVSNIDAEHLDHYKGGLPDVVEAFHQFVSRVPFYGLAVLCIDHPVVRELAARVERRKVTYGFSADADVRATKVEFGPERTKFTLITKGVEVQDIYLPLLGEHNVQNALGAFAIAQELGVELEVIRRAFASFQGVDRRFSRRGAVGNVLVVDDYGHHPEEIRATLQGARKGYANRRILVGFQPHRYTRTRDLMSEFAGAFAQADEVALAPVYGAGEDAIAGATSESLAEAIHARTGQRPTVSTSVDDLARSMAQRAETGDLLIFFGAGDVVRASQVALSQLRERFPARPDR